MPKFNLSKFDAQKTKKISEPPYGDIIKIGKSEPYRYYLVELNKKLGEGGYGEVYKAYSVDQNGECDFEKPCVVKIFKDSNNFSQKEAKIQEEAKRFARFYWAEKPQKIDGKMYWVTKFFDGHILTDGFAKDNDLDKMDFQQRIDLLFNIALSVHLIHSKRIIHADIKGYNIIWNHNFKGRKEETEEETEEKTESWYFDDKGCTKGRNDVSIIDFGLSMYYSMNAEESGCKTIPTDGEKVTAGYKSPEVSKHFIGMKSDIFSLVPVYAHILGNTFPFKNLEETNVPGSRIQHSYSYELGSVCFNMPNYPHNIKRCILGFLQKMGEVDYEYRVGKDELLTFWTTVNQYCKVYDKCQNDERLTSYYAKMLLLSSQGNLWNPNIRKVEMEDKGGTVTHYKTFADFDFDGNPDFCKAIIALGEANLLMLDIVDELMQPGGVSKVLINFINALEKAKSITLIAVTKLLWSGSELKKAISALDKAKLLTSTDIAVKLTQPGNVYEEAIIALSEAKFLTKCIVAKLAQPGEASEDLAKAIIVLKNKNLLFKEAVTFLETTRDANVYKQITAPAPDAAMNILLTDPNCKQVIYKRFIEAYKSECWFPSFFGGLGRSDFGKKVFNGSLSMENVSAYVKDYFHDTARSAAAIDSTAHPATGGAAVRAIKKLGWFSDKNSQDPKTRNGMVPPNFGR